MKTFRFFSAMIGLCLSLSVMAQKALTEDGSKAQQALVEYMRSIGVSPKIDTKDNSVCFKRNDVLYWVTFEENSPVSYTIHRNGIKFDKDSLFKPSCARYACNEVNRKHNIKCTYNGKSINFIMQTYAKEPSDFHGGFRKMLASFKGVDETFKKAYDAAYDKWKKDSIEKNQPIIPKTPVGNSPLKVTYICFGNFDAKGGVISNYDEPLRQDACKYIQTGINVLSSEKGIFKIGMKIFNPDGKAMVATKGVEYSSTTNIEIKKVDKEQQCTLSPFGDETPDFWKAGEYKVEIYDFEKGALLHTTTFNLL